MVIWPVLHPLTLTTIPTGFETSFYGPDALMSHDQQHQSTDLVQR